MKKYIAFCGLALIIAMTFIACRNHFVVRMLRPEHDPNSGASGSSSSTPVVPWTDSEFAYVAPVEVTGKPIHPIDNPAAGGTRQYRGVFTAGRKVKLSAYWIAKKELTYKLWYEVYQWATGPSGGPGQPAAPYTFSGAHQGTEGNNGPMGAPPSTTTPGQLEPVANIDWTNSVIWCNAYTEKTRGLSECVYRSGDADSTVIRNYLNATRANLSIAQMKKNHKRWGYRLPTEAEWEWAARFQGANPVNGVQYGSIYLTKMNSVSGASVNYTVLTAPGLTGSHEVNWNNGNSSGTTHPVGQKTKNFLEMFDVSGNVFEWCFDVVNNLNGDPRANDTEYTNAEGFVENPLGDAPNSGNIDGIHDNAGRGGTFYHPNLTNIVGRRDRAGHGSQYNGIRLAYTHKQP